MEIQNQVSRILRDNLARLRDVLDEATGAGVGSLVQVADRVCEAFDFRDGRDRWQRASCCRALSDLQAAGHVSLPAGRGARGGGGRARVLPHPLAPAVDVPGTVGAVVGLTLELVETDEQRAGLEHADGLRAPARGRSVRRPATAVSGGFGAWLAGRRRVCGECAAAAVPRRLGRVGRCGPARAPAPGAGTVPAAGAPRHRVSQPGLARAGPGRPGGRRRLRGSVWLSPLAAGDVRGRDRTDGGERARGELGSGG